MKITKEMLPSMNPEEVIPVEFLLITGSIFKREKIKRELKYAGFIFKEYRNWWGSDFKILGSYKVQKLINLFDWLDGNEEIIRSGTASDKVTRTIVEPRF